MKIGLAALAAALMLAGPAVAAPTEIGQAAQGVIYYNQPGAKLARHNDDLQACIQDSRSQTKEQANLGRGLLFDGAFGALQWARVENCMLVKGWRAVRVSDADAADLAPLKGQELVARLEPWIGAREPHGEVARTFGNEALHPGAYTTVTLLAAKGPSKQHLSFRLYAESGMPEPGWPEAFKPSKLDPQWPKGTLKPAEIAKAPPGSAIVVMRAMGIGSTFGAAPSFVRIGPGPNQWLSQTDHAPDLLSAMITIFQIKKGGTWFIWAAPPGRWTIASSNFLGYCLGAPSFEARAGEVIYAGTFHVDGPDLTPDLDLQPAKDYLGGDAAKKMQPAVYRNGDRRSCLGFAMDYALEFPGAPFAPGYTMGSMAKTP